MTLSTSILSVFTQKPGKWWTAKKIKDELSAKGVAFNDYRFGIEFLELRKTFSQDGFYIVKMSKRAFNNQYYVLTDNEKLIQGHNNQLNKEINNRKKRIIKVA